MTCALRVPFMNDPVRPPDAPERVAQTQRDLRWLATSPWLLARAAPDGQYAGDARPAAGASPASDDAILPPLADWPAHLVPVLQHWLASPDGAASVPPVVAAPKRLGRYAELLLGGMLAHLPGVQVLAANLPIRRMAGQGNGVDTLGELDFVWRDLASGLVIHWELATKFYLLIPEPDLAASITWMHFVGPNLADRFGDKLSHIATRQLPLSRIPEARAALGCNVDRAEAYLKGWLFYPLERPGVRRSGRLPTCLATDHLNGWWGTLGQFADGLPGDVDGLRWCLLPRALWLSPARLDTGSDGLLEHADMVSALYQRFHSGSEAPAYLRTMPVMICGLRRETDGAGRNGWYETTRGFIVPDGWTALALRRAHGERVEPGWQMDGKGG